jgi:hypothetical protein
MWIALVVLGLIGIVGSGGGGGGGLTTPAHAPSISNFSYSPASALKTAGGAVTITGSVNFTDDGGDIAALRLTSSGGADVTVPVTGASGVKTGTGMGSFVVSLDTLGRYSFDIWLVDSEGSESNRLSGTFDVVLNDFGTSWTRMASDVSAWLHRVIWTGSQFVIVGDGGTILTSPDGSTWIARDSHTTSSLMGVASSGSKLVAVGNPATVVASSDGVTWVASVLPVTGSTTLTGIARSGAEFVAVGHDTNADPMGGTAAVALRSVDGSNWTSASLGPYTLYTVVWTGSQFLAAGSDVSGTNGAPAVLRSTDGKTWVADVVNTSSVGTWLGDIAASGAGSGSTIVAVGYQAVLSSVAGAPWANVANAALGGANAVGWSGARFLACSNQCIWSGDGLNWPGNTPPPTGLAYVGLPVDAVISSVAWGGPGDGRWIAVGYTGGIFASP